MDDLLELVLLMAGVAALFVALCAGERIAELLAARFDWFAAWLSEPESTEDERVDRVRDGGA